MTIQLSVAIVTLLASVYMLTYSGRILSGDELYLYDTTASFARFGDFLLGVATGSRPPQDFDNGGFYPMSAVGAEPLQIVLASSLYRLATRLPGIGLVHATWLFNVLVVALAGGLMFAYGRALGYSLRASVLASLALGLGTAAWPYSKSFFREPLAMLLLLAAALALERWRQCRYHALGWMALAAVAIVAAVLTKAPSVLALPALLLIAAPSPRNMNRRALVGLVAAAGLIALVFVVLAVFGDALGIGQRFNPVARLIDEAGLFVSTALSAYLLSIGGSIWGTSPVGLLALPGMWLLWRAGRPRYIAVVALAVLIFALGNAAFTGPFWFGGLSWPMRFLLPVVPFLVLGALPALERVVARPIPTGLAAVTVVVFVYAVWVQLSGVTLAWGDYGRGLPPEAGGLLEWHGGLYDLRYLRWVVIPGLWDDIPLDFAWSRAHLPGWPVAFGLLALACLGLIWRALRGHLARGPVWAALPVVFVAGAGLGLRALAEDPLYAPVDRPGLMPILDVINAETGPGDVVMLASDEYAYFFHNYGKVHDARVVGLGTQPGDRPGEAQTPQVASDNPDLLLDRYILGMIYNLARPRERLWLLESRGPELPWAPRPVERFMARHYFPARVLQTDPPDPTVRLIEYATAAAPSPYAFRGPSYGSDLVFGDSFRLVGYDLPLGETYSPGALVPIALYWQPGEQPDADYRVAWFVRDSAGAPVAQGWDSRPGGDFEATSEWLPGVPHWDNRALRLPAGLEAGEYQMWVKVYVVDETMSPMDLPVTAGEAAGETIGILPTRLTVR